MTRPGAARLACGLFGLFVVLLGLTGVMAAIAPPPPPGVEPVTADAIIFSVGLLGIVTVGTLVAGRHPAVRETLQPAYVSVWLKESR